MHEFPFLGQIDPNLMSLTGVIATILAVIFALGAFYNSRNRRKHMEELERSQKQEPPMHFRPAATHYPGRSSRPSRSSRPGAASASSPARTAPVAKPASESSKPDASRGKEKTVKEATAKPVLFRKVRPDGMERGVEPDEEDEELYVWE